MGSAEFVDPYLIPGTSVLRNLVGATTSAELAAAEADLSFARATQLLNDPVFASNDLDELKAIHFRLFRDVYKWAGQLRTVDVRKDIPGADFFLPFGYIELAAANSFRDLAADKHLKGLEREAFVGRLAFHYEKINYVHPFREGNGRTQRVFWNRVAREAGWELDWRSVHGEENHLAARAGSDDGDLLPLIRMFDKVVSLSAALNDEHWSISELRRLSIALPESDMPD